MKDEIFAWLHDIRAAAEAIQLFTSGKTFQEFRENELLRSAIERKFEIIGEALNRIKKEYPEELMKIRNHRDIISFRNILIHGYDMIDDVIVWNIIEEDIEPLLEDIYLLIGC